MSTVGTKMRKQRVRQPPLEGVRSAGAEPRSTGVRATHFEFAGDDYVVLSCPQYELVAPSALTSSEQAVFSALLSGRSNEEIALGRDRSQSTIANQVAAIFRKLGVGSRAELVAKFTGQR